MWPFGPLSKGNFRHEMTTIVGNRGQLWTSALSPHLLSPHLDFPDECTEKSRIAIRYRLFTADSGFLQCAVGIKFLGLPSLQKCVCEIFGEIYPKHQNHLFWELNLFLKFSLKSPNLVDFRSWKCLFYWV